MKISITTIASRLLDGLTAALFVGAVFVVLRPASPLRTAWATFESNRVAVNVVRHSRSTLDSVGSRLSGGSDSLMIVEVSDYQCTYCRAAASVVDDAAARGISVVYMNFPQSAKPGALNAATAALCADAAGRFPQMHKQLMTSTQWQRDSNWVREAKAAGVVDLAAFSECLRGQRVQLRLARQRTFVDSLKVTATPTFVSPRGVHRGVPTVQRLLELGGLRN